MATSASDTRFGGSIPQLYERYLVPLIFEPYAADLAQRVSLRRPSRVLEIAAGTGVVTRQLANVLPPVTSIVASDISQPMLDQAAAVGTSRPVEWHQGDAMQLPFADESFDVVLCQFGIMFVPDKAKAFSEVKRVLRPGGALLFNVWDRIEANEFADTVERALAALFPEDPPRFLARVPHGYCHPVVIAQDLARGGFDRPLKLTTLTERSHAPSARIAAMAYCEGTPLRGEIEARGPSLLQEATDRATTALAEQFGSGPIDGQIQAHVVLAER